MSALAVITPTSRPEIASAQRSRIKPGRALKVTSIGGFGGTFAASDSSNGPANKLTLYEV
jgi:hypothetical protein